MSDEELGTMTQRHTRARDSVASAHKDRGVLLAEVERLRAEVAELRALGVSLHKSAAMGRDAERAAVVAWLHYAADTRYYDCCCGPVAACADAIERGEHRREGGE